MWWDDVQPWMADERRELLILILYDMFLMMGR